jgi:uncharacterized membrane protein YsdA (DUF1294 family)
MLRILGTALIALLAIAAALFGPKLVWLPAVYLLVGAVSMLAYWLDKRAARAGRWRIRESWLHGLDLIGGIAGGLVAQELLRHKTSKQSFIVVTGLIAVGHIGALTWLGVAFH